MIRHLSWSFLLRWFTRGLTFLRIAILARLLLPTQFGIFAIGTLVLAFLEILTETWINIFLIQERGEIDRFVNTAWVISIVRGIIISSLIALCAPLIAGFFKSPQALPTLYLVSVVPFLRGFINPSQAKLQKNLLFKQEFFFRTAIFIFESLVTIVFALFTRLTESLAIGMVASSSLELLLSHLVFAPHPRFQPQLKIFKEITKRGKWVTLAGICNYLYQNGDNIAVGRLLGSASLGIYDYAYKLSSIPITELGDVFAKVAFPMYVKLHHQPVQLRRSFLRNSAIVSGAGLGASVVIFLFSPVIVPLLLGPAWVATIPVIRILAIYGTLKTIIGTFFPLFLAVRKQEYVTITSLTLVIGLGTTIVPLVNSYGVNGAALSAVIGAICAFPVSLIYMRKALAHVAQNRA